jgi:predicted nicotinamide N-methyase
MPEQLCESSESIDADRVARFATKTEKFEYARVSLRLVLPRAADELLDEEAFERDERMPYWAELWPSAIALAQWLLDQQSLPHCQMIELGCGLALPSMVVSARGGTIVATDHNEDALIFARFNAVRNGLGQLATRLLDWRSDASELGQFDMAIAADVLYEQRNAHALAELLPRILKPHGRLIFADPGRRHLPLFQQVMRHRGWTEAALDSKLITQNLSTSQAQPVIQLISYRSPN